MPDLTMHDAQPVYGYRKNVFVINDIDLIVPPTNINVQIEDLTWQWKALRQRASTKIPSGQGQIAIQVTLPFTGPQVLDMHRLIVEFRHSPFCYIENRFLRETIVPHWPYTQAMAFTMTGLSVAPMQGSSDTWIMQLDLTWFNYQPYVHNWLYRKDWHTVPVVGQGGLDTGRPVECTIGWKLEGGVKVPQHNVLPALAATDGEVYRSWDLVQNQYKDKQFLTIEEMEETHRGEIFDLLPLPDKMAKAQYVQRPSKSLIYTRYINHLQRDALLQNFGIDVEALIQEQGLHKALFSAVLLGHDRYTFGLHTGPPIASNIYQEWVILRDSIIRKMNSFHGGAAFHYFAYQEVRLPQEWNEAISAAHQHSLENAAAKVPAISDLLEQEGWIIQLIEKDTKPIYRYRVRSGWSRPLGNDDKPRVAPVGHKGEETPMPIGDLRIVSWPKWRSVDTRNAIYPGNNFQSGYTHWGTDFGVPEGAPVFAVEGGRVSSITLTNNSAGGFWRFVDSTDPKAAKQAITDGDDFRKSIEKVVPGAVFDGNNVKAKHGTYFPVGTFVKSLAYETGYYFVESNSAGNRITLSHGNNVSHYFHLSEVVKGLKVGDKVDAGTLIAYAGRSGPLSTEYRQAQLKEASRLYEDWDVGYHSPRNLDNTWDAPGEEASSVWHLVAHLHFEYWETTEYGAHRDDPWEGSPELPENWRSSSRLIPVDPRLSFELSPQDGYIVKHDPALTAPTKTTAKSTLSDDENLEEVDMEAIGQLLDNLWADGWMYYDRDSKITNVWWKNFHHVVAPGNPESLSSGLFNGDPTVLTAVAGGLRHVVANIPILGHEFPTQQHLGSVEPFYSFEFCSVDWEGTGTQRLAGVSKDTEVLTSIRTLLHANARDFRGITDSWCVAVDSFVTRLLGTFRASDVQAATFDISSDTEEIISDIEVKRRMLSTRASSQTVQGHPGLSAHTFEFMETNPYEGEAISATAPQKTEIDAAYREILNAVYNLEFEPGVENLLQKVLVAQLAGANTYFPAESDYGQFSLSYTTNPRTIGSDNVALYRDSSDKDWLIFGDDFSPLASGPGSVGSLVSSDTSSVPFLKGLNAVPLDQVFGDSTGGGVASGGTAGGFVSTGHGPLVDAYATAYSGSTTTGGVTPKEFDISSLLKASQDTMILGEVPMEKILTYWMMIHKTLRTANLMLAETEDQLSFGTITAGGSTIDYARGELYDLPVTPGLFKHFSIYLLFVAGINPKYGPGGPWFGKPSSAEVYEHYYSNPNTLRYHDAYKPDREAVVDIYNIFNLGNLALQVTDDAFDTIGSGFQLAWDFATAGGAYGFAWSALTGTTKSSEEGVLADLISSRLDAVLRDISVYYMRNLPVKNLLEERFKEFVSSSMFGDVLGGVLGDSETPVFSNTLSNLKKIVASCGDFQVVSYLDTGMYLVTDRTLSYGDLEALAAERDGETSTDVALDADTGVPQYIGDAGSGAGHRSLRDQGIENGEFKLPTYNPSSGWDWYWYKGAEQVRPINSPFIWLVEPQLEAQKIRYFKQLLARYAADLRNDVDVLAAFGLRGLANINRSAQLKGSPALPDMDLPHHPYYGTVSSCPPDFYMWNMYEDGDAHNETIMSAVTDVMGDIISNCYNSMKRVESGGTYEPASGRFVQDPNIDDRLSLPQYYNAEATDTGKKGVTAFPFYPNPDSTESIATHIGKINDSASKAKEDAESARSGTLKDSDPDIRISKKQAEALDGVHVEDVRLSNFEAAYGVGGGVMYPRRVSQATYDELRLAVKSVDRMFGHRAGYLEQKEIPDDLKDRLRGTLLERDEDPSHRFDVESLNRLALNSAADIFGRKRQMRRAYPTFKLFFVEEDEFESRLLNFDDFYSYNGVTSFTIEQNRKSPADHAIISLLNVAGTLDGTKRDAVVDMDYFSDADKINVPGEASKLAGDPTTQGSALDQPFGALILRPGLNVQLRVGYSNDPSLLEVMISGRVVDVTWNQGGDRAEILVQSFGAELQQAIKGTSSEGTRTYPTTHHALGAMMLEPELLHFGRWEFGKLYQIGEGTDARLDFNDYSREGFMGRFRAPSAVSKWFLDHPYITASLAIGGGIALNRIPGVGRLLRPVSGPLLRASTALGKAAAKPRMFAWVARWLGAAEIELAAIGGGPQTAGYFRTVLADAAGSRLGTAVTAASRVELQEVSAALAKNAAQRQLRTRALKGIGGAALREQAWQIQKQAIAKAAGSTIDDAARVLARADGEIQTLLLKHQWMAHPSMILNGQAVGLVRAIGFKPISRIFGGLWPRWPALLGGIALASLPLAGLDWLFSWFYDGSIGRLKAYFRSKQVSLFLSPQDDNLFPPHPKDYMEIYDSAWTETWSQLKRWVVKQGVSAIVTDDDLGYQAARWFEGSDPLDKRAPPDQWEFMVNSTTIWDVFHEMSLRHPGWVYAARPYGTEFRYTMFFGVPSQRYWAQGADNQFVRRANDLVRFLGSADGGSEITKDEYARLYGDFFDEDGTSVSIDVVDERIIEEASYAATEVRVGEGSVKTVYVDDSKAGESVPVKIQADLFESNPELADENEKVEKSIRQLTYTSRALKEYLRALELRFKPFRRYHSITSDHDLVWNGLISSENAVYNAVDVTYFKSGASVGDSPASSSLFKAHAMIPEHQLRVLPLEPSYNVRGYQMAMRYGQGALLHTMREMYRGEIIVLGNPRIRPWDVGILQDSYNDMVGPFEVEQVVHQFSHETGFVTELKPSALVIANETSSWPVLEAMKVAALAMRDVDDQFLGLTASDPGARFKAIDWALGFGAGGDVGALGEIAEKLGYPGGSEEYREYLRERAKELRPFDPFADPDTGKSDLEALRRLQDDITGSRTVEGLTLGAGALLGFTTAAVALKGLPWVLGAAGEVPRFVRVVSPWAKGAMALVGAGGAFTALNRTTPSLAWLLGGPILFMQCLRGDSIMLIPLMKNGNPIVSGLSLNDPSMIWNNFKGQLGRWVEDHMEGTKDLTELWRLYGSHAWRRNEALTKKQKAEGGIYDENRQLYAELTGETF